MARTRTEHGYTVDQVSTSDRGRYYLVKSPHGTKVTLDPWDTHALAEIRTLVQLRHVLARYGEQVPASLEEAA